VDQISLREESIVKSTTKIFGVLLLPAIGMFLVACGGGKVVVIPNPATPGPSAIVATAPVAPAQVVVTTVPAMPAVPADVAQGVSPGPNYFWVAGYYDWRGDHYAWVPGNWMLTPTTTSVWVSAHWENTAGGYTWVPGHWR
jgi:hypothetical protein